VPAHRIQSTDSDALRLHAEQFRRTAKNQTLPQMGDLGRGLPGLRPLKGGCEGLCQGSQLSLLQVVLGATHPTAAKKTTAAGTSPTEAVSHLVDRDRPHARLAQRSRRRMSRWRAAAEREPQKPDKTGVFCPDPPGPATAGLRRRGCQGSGETPGSARSPGHFSGRGGGVSAAP